MGYQGFVRGSIVHPFLTPPRPLCSRACVQPLFKYSCIVVRRRRAVDVATTRRIVCGYMVARCIAATCAAVCAIVTAAVCAAHAACLLALLRLLTPPRWISVTELGCKCLQKLLW
jgi:hypothetical protein